MPPPPKPFAWSYSGLKAFETCPFQWQQVMLLKNFSSAKGPELIWGDRVHKAIAVTLKSGGKTPLPDEMLIYQDWVDSLLAMPGDHFVEEKYAITKDFAPCEYYAPNVWYRGIADFLALRARTALALDWKTGKVLDDPVQLLLMSQLIFSHYPKIELVRAQFVWLKHGCSSEQLVTRQDIANNWIGLMDRVNAMKEAFETKVCVPKPSGLCRKHCPVRTCQYHGKGAY